MDADLAAFVDAGVDAHAIGLFRRPVAGQPPDRGQEVAVRVLGIDARLDRPAVELHVILLDRQLLAVGDADHPFHQIEAGDEFGHRMLDLQARIHLEEEKVALGVDDELDRAGRLVVDRLGQSDRLLAHRLAHGGGEERDSVPPRLPSGGGAESNIRARRDRSRCHGSRPAPGSRYGAAARYISR